MDLLPQNWDSSKIEVDMIEMNDIAQSVLASAQNINNDLGDIANSLSGLPMAWTGPSASLADEFNTRFVNATNTLYGPQGDPGAGILNIVTNGLSAAAQNYANVEDQISGTFNQWSAAGTSASSGPPSPVTDQVTNTYYHTTSVDEAFQG
jgi:hypothetical protein